jgi:RNA polymerase sigma factor (sigma-70 family)
MMEAGATAAAPTKDAELVAQSLSGSREAFGHIVARYQSLICSLAYSATGSLGQSEDLAQETFITAWKHLRLLREPDRLRSWLCGIARNRIHSFLRRENRQPLSQPEPLDAVCEAPAAEPLPSEQAITREEQALLWRALHQLPELYREPLVLYYREHQSLEHVAADLEISEDAAKQRLSRGRRLLQEQVLAFVEGALEHTTPGKAFTLGVLAALPFYAASASAATVSAVAAKGSATAKAAAAASAAGALLGTLVSFLGIYVGFRVSQDRPQSPRARAVMQKFYRLLLGSILVFIVLGSVLATFGRGLVQTHPTLFCTLAVGLITVYTGVIAVSSVRLFRAEGRLVLEQAAAPQTEAPRRPAWEYRSQATLFGLPLVHIRLGGSLATCRQPVKAWVAVADHAIGVVFAFGGIAIAPLAMGGLAIGLLPFGGCALGLVALGGLAIGWWSFGGCGIGWLAYASCALAWKAAIGALAIGHDFALGSAAYAAHFNDAPAQAFAKTQLFFRWGEVALHHLYWLNLLWVVPLTIWWRVEKRHHSGNRL